MTLEQIRQLIERYRAGTATPEEKSLIEQWFRQTELLPVQLSDEEKQQTEKELLAAIRRQTGYDQENHRLSFFRRIGYPLIRVAAVLLAAVGLYFLFRPHPVPVVAEHTVAPQQAPAPVKPVHFKQVMAGQQVKKIQLPDGSLVWLNSASRLRYPDRFGDSLREVYLEEGEAFFEVQNGTRQPFLVHSAAADTRVLGTSFSVSAYKKLRQSVIVVKTGKISVTTYAARHAVKTVQLGALQGISFRPGSAAATRFEMPASAIAGWKAGGLSFYQNSWREIALALENRFDVRIRLDNEALLNCRYTASFTAQHTLTQILDMLALVHPMQYSLQHKQVTITGEGCL